MQPRVDPVPRFLLAPGTKKTTFYSRRYKRKRHSAAPRARKLIHLLGNHLRIFIAAKHGAKGAGCLAYFLSVSGLGLREQESCGVHLQLLVSVAKRQDTGCD
jgi:hypothetical protein